MTIKIMEVLFKEYKVMNGTCYNVETPDAVIRCLENAKASRQRVRLYYGDKEKGLDWMEEFDTMGTIGRSGGNVKIPLLINNSRSTGGGGILTGSIVKITIDKRIVYIHPKYHQPDMSISKVDDEKLLAMGYTHNVDFYGVNHARFKSERQAERYMAFLKGESNRK